MPTFELSGPDGGTYHVDAPDETVALNAFHSMNGTAAPADTGSSLSGVAKSLGSGLAQGALGLAGLPADLAHLYAPNSNDPNPLGAEGLQKKVEQYTGDFYKPQGAAEDIASKIGQFAPAVIGGPETLAAKAATRVVAPALASEAAGKFAEGTAAQPYAEIAGALAGGAGASSVAQKFNAMAAARAASAVTPSLQETKAASRLLYQHPDVAAVQIKPEAMSALADKIDVDLQQGTNSGFRPANEPKVFNAVNELRTPASGTVSDTPEQIAGAAIKSKEGQVFSGTNHGGAATALFKAGHELDPAEAGDGFVTNSGRFVNRDEALDIADKAKQLYDPTLNHTNRPDAWLHARDLRPGVAAPRPANISDLDNVRQVLGGLAKEKDAIGQPTRQAAAAARAMDHINDFLPNLQQPDLLAGNAVKANDILNKARANWAAFKKSSTVQNTLSNAELNAASANSGGNIQNSIKQGFKPLLKNNGAKTASWSPDEKAALNSVVRGTWTGSAARAAGNLLGGGGGLGMLVGGAAGYEEGGVPGAIAAGLAGRAFKKIGNASTMNAVKRLDTLIRSGSPEAMRIAAQTPQIAQKLPSKSIRLLRTMILAEPALSQSQQQQRQPVS